MTVRYDDVVPDLRASYHGGAAERDKLPKQQFKLDERAVSLDRLRVVEAKTLLEIGAGAGQDAVFFAEEGLDVVGGGFCRRRCGALRAKGLEAYERDFLHLGFEPGSFDAVYSLNSLLHVPNADLPDVLRAVRAVLKPGGLFYVGVGVAVAGGRLRRGHPAAEAVLRVADRRGAVPVRPGVVQVRLHVTPFEDKQLQSLTLVRPPELPPPTWVVVALSRVVSGSFRPHLKIAGSYPWRRPSRRPARTGHDRPSRRGAAGRSAARRPSRPGPPTRPRPGTPIGFRRVDRRSCRRPRRPPRWTRPRQ